MNLVRWKMALAFAAVLTLCLLPTAEAKPSEQIKDKYQQLLKSASVTEILTEALRNSENAEIDSLGDLLSVRATEAAQVLDALSRDGSTEAATLRSELLVWMARGDEMPMWKRKERKGKPETMSTDQVGRRAAKLLGYPDPFVRGLAEWAISICVGIENAGGKAIWPTDDVPSWYEQWQQTLQGDSMLEFDYIRQAVQVGSHRSRSAILKSAEATHDRVRRAADTKGMAKWTAFEDVYNKLRAAAESQDADLTELRRLWLKLRRTGREVVLGNQDTDFAKILFATRHAYHDGPNITAGAKSYIIKPGGDIFVKSGFDIGDSVRPLINGKLAPGHMRGMELWWGGDRIVFAYTQQPRYYTETLIESDQGFDDKRHGASEPVHIYEIQTNGTALRQITDHPFNSDVEPAYLPNGDIVFCSDRANFGSQCSGSFLQNKKIVNLYRSAADGSNIRVFHNNKDFDRYPHVMDNGLILYTRWEYQERHLWQTHNLWTTRPDGTMTDPIYKEHINSGPMALRDARQIRGSHKLVAIACGHHEYAQGALTIIDHHIGLNDSAGMRIVTPRISPREGGIGRGKTVTEGGVEEDGGLYQQPYPLSEQRFLASYSYHLPRSDKNASSFGIYYIDVWGNKELIHRDPVLSAVYPIPLKKRPVPPVIPDLVDQKNFALCFLGDVYDGLDGVHKGEVKYIRIANRTEQPTFHTGDGVTEFNHLHYVPDGSWAHALGVWTWTPARVIGIVPVEEDGSAYFKVPTNVPLYFQALDENFMELRRMRSFVSFQPGEVRGCTGCHETRNQTPPRHVASSKALSRPPSSPKPPVWGDTMLPDYERHIQPILTKHCTGCHGEKDPEGGLEFTARKFEHQCQSYRTMFGLSSQDRTPFWSAYNYKLMYPDEDPLVNKDALKKMAKNQYPGQLVSLSDRFSDASITEVKQFGSHKSKLITTLLGQKHKERVKMDREEWIALVTWVDLNAPYWGSFVDKEPVRRKERPKRVFLEFPSPFESPVGPCRIVETRSLSKLDVKPNVHP